jgi:UDP-GlcNAc:undecaprenyl-phosphate GlcNAc-1-phosphate transferase
VLFLISFVVALAVTMALLPALILVAPKLGFLDLPGPRKVHSTSMPRIGGVAIVTGALIATVLCRGSEELWVTLLAILVILAFGAWDDRANIDYRLKFLGQVIAALLVTLVGGVVIEQVPFWHGGPLSPIVSIPLTVFALLGATNAVNLSDGLDGLAGGLTLLTFGAIALLAHMAGGLSIVILAVGMMGSILGFLRFNTRPARVFMGDSGSQSLGFAAGVLAILLTQKVDPSLSSVLPLFLLGLPILDTVMVVIQRAREGRSPFSPDKNHIHHKLLQRGFDDYEVVLIIYCAHAALVSVGYFLRDKSDQISLLAYIGMCAALMLILLWPRRVRLQKRSGARLKDMPQTGAKAVRNMAPLTRWLFGYVLVAVLTYLFFGAVLGGDVPREMGAIALVLLAVLLVMYLRRHGGPINILERAGLYVASAYAIYLTQTPISALQWVSVFDSLFFLLLAIAVTLAVLSSNVDRFKLTTTDFLVWFMALTVLFLPSEYFQSFDQRLALIKLIVLFYSIELLHDRFGSHGDEMRIAMMAAFAAVCVRGLM